MPVHSYRGVPLVDMSRDELIAVINEQHACIQQNMEEVLRLKLLGTELDFQIARLKVKKKWWEIF